VVVRRQGLSDGDATRPLFPRDVDEVFVYELADVCREHIEHHHLHADAESDRTSEPESVTIEAATALMTSGTRATEAPNAGETDQETGVEI
jgi:hypothetical protein